MLLSQTPIPGRDTGARPLKRAIQQYIQNPLAVEVLQGTIHEGNDVETDLDLSGDRLVFNVVRK